MNKYIGYKEFEVSALNSLRISSITNIDLLDNVIFNLIKGTEGSKISSEDVGLFLDGLKVNESLNNGTEESSFVTEGSIFKKPLKEAREEFEKLYFEFHMQNQASVSELSKKSGVERTHLYRKLKSLGIKSK
jgi:DNA-binding NtrC family response regulator